jgi:hypothetical protein
MALERRFSNAYWIGCSSSKLRVGWFLKAGQCEEVADVILIHHPESFFVAACGGTKE